MSNIINIKEYVPSEEIKNFIKGREGLRLKAYLCPAGVWTIGYGHTVGVNMGDTITEEQANKYFDADIKSYSSSLIRFIYVEKYNELKLTQGMLDALLSLSYNAGLVSTRLILNSLRAGYPLNKVISYEYISKNGYKQAVFMEKYNEKGDVPYYLFLFRQYISVNGKPVYGLYKRRTDEYYSFFIK